MKKTHDEQRLKFHVPEMWQNEPVLGLPKEVRLPKNVLSNIEIETINQPQPK
ncbi:hypothetical protein H6794_02395 [Candidatus Nomurabacteria bacterium]|nr:hypothetical protein [Candidatus Saccharibacteria bacterium]MCB9839681.1 hypothetical protein [Candidatus Nomurabacteria bacterium]